MSVGELLKKKGQDVINITSDASYDDARALMNEKHIGALMVVDGGAVKGIVTERDLLSKMGTATTVDKLMTPRAKLTTLVQGDTLQTAMKIFTEKRVRHLPVMNGDTLEGIVSIGDAVKTLLDQVALENKYLKEYIMGQD